MAATQLIITAERRQGLTGKSNRLTIVDERNASSLQLTQDHRYR